MTMARRSAGAKPRSRPMISKLAASRLTSHSHGPGRVSSKSLMSNSIRRSGEPNRPKFDRCASPHSCTVTPDTGVAARSAAMISARAPVERERRDQHPPVPDRDQLGDPGRRLLLQQRDRVRAVRCGLPPPVARPRRLSRAARPRATRWSTVRWAAPPRGRERPARPRPPALGPDASPRPSCLRSHRYSRFLIHTRVIQPQMGGR